MTPEALLKAHARVIERVMDVAVHQPFGSDAEVAPYLTGSLWRRDGTRLGSVAQTASGCQFLTWRYPEIDGPEPVVFLGDGILGVVAPDVRTFVHALGSGFTCAAGVWETGGWDEDDDRALLPFQRAVKQEWGALPAKPRILARQAAGAHPDFGRWIAELSGPAPRVVRVPCEPPPPPPPREPDAFVPMLVPDPEIVRARSEAEIGLQLWREGKWAEAFGHLETAVMSLSAQDPLTKPAFEALDDLEKRGIVGT